MASVTGPAAFSQRGAGVLLALVVLLLGVNWPVMKIGLGAMDPIWFGATRVLLASFCYAALLVARGRLALPNRQDLPALLTGGVFQMGLMLGLLTFGLKRVDAGRSAILIYTTSLWMLPGAVLFLRERASVWQLVGWLTGMAGVAVLFNPLDFPWSNRSVLIGNACLLLAALSWAVALLQARGHRWRLDPLQLLPWQSLIGAALLIPFAAWQEGFPPVVAWSSTFALVMLYNVVIATCFSLWALMAAARTLPAITLSIGQLATPIVSTASAALILGERPTFDKVAGLACILTGVVLASLAGRWRRYGRTR